MKLAALLLLSLAPFLASADQATPTENDPVTAARAVHLGSELRCLVCQNQTIADSNAELAVDLRRQIREQIAAGKTDDQIIGFMVGRYGEFVLYRPRFKATTLLLWLGPALLVLAGFWTLARSLRGRRRVDEPVLTAEERERAERLLAGEPREKP